MIANYQKRFKIDSSQDVDSSLWDKLPAHVREENVEPLEGGLVESDGDEELEDEDPLQEEDVEEVDELASDVESSAEVSQILKPASVVEESVAGDGAQVAEEEEESGHSVHATRGSQRSLRSQGSPRGTQLSIAKGKRKRHTERVDEQQEDVEEPVPLIHPSDKGKQRALSPREASSAPVATSKKRKLVRRTASVVECPIERPTKRRRLATTVVNVSDSEG